MALRKAWNKGLKLSVEYRKKLSDSHKGLRNSSESKEKASAALRGKKKSETHRVNAMLARRAVVDDAFREKMSRLTTARILNGSFKPNVKRCRPHSFFSEKNSSRVLCRSGLEHSWCQVFERCPAIVAYRIEPMHIPYAFEGRVRNYIPDVWLKLSGRRVLVEFKPEFYWSDAVNLAKWAAAVEWCLGRSFPTTFVVLGYDDLKILQVDASSGAFNMLVGKVRVGGMEAPRPLESGEVAKPSGPPVLQLR